MAPAASMARGPPLGDEHAQLVEAARVAGRRDGVGVGDVFALSVVGVRPEIAELAERRRAADGADGARGVGADDELRIEARGFGEKVEIARVLGDERGVHGGPAHGGRRVHESVRPCRRVIVRTHQAARSDRAPIVVLVAERVARATGAPLVRLDERERRLGPDRVVRMGAVVERSCELARARAHLPYARPLLVLRRVRDLPLGHGVCQACGLARTERPLALMGRHIALQRREVAVRSGPQRRRRRARSDRQAERERGSNDARERGILPSRS